MQMKVGAGGFGIGIPKTSLGVGVAIVGKMFFRENTQKNKETVFVIGDWISLGQKSGTFIAGAIETDWFELDPVKDNWIYNLNWLLGKTAEIKITGLQVIRGKTDIEIVVIDKDNRSYELAKRCSLKSRGTQCVEIKIRGPVKRSGVNSKGKTI